MEKQKWDGVSTIVIPADVAKCPECGAEIYVDIYETTLDDHETEWKVNEDGSGLHIQCTKEDDDHYRHPYIDWLPLEHPVIRWINKTYDFNPYPVT